MDEVELLLLGRRWLVAFEARVALREVVAEQRLLAAGLQKDPLLLACLVDEQGQAQRDNTAGDDGATTDQYP